MNVTAVIYHDTRRKKKSCKYPVKLRVTYDRQQRYYPYGSKFDLTVEAFEAVFSPKPRGDNKRIQDELIRERNRADEIIGSLGKKFSFTLFDRRFKEAKSNSRDLFILLEKRGKKLRENDQISTAVFAECALSSLKKFHPYPELDLEEIDSHFLNKYERWMIKNGRKSTTVGMYIKDIRTIFNEAIKEGLIAKELYPFGTSKSSFHIPVGRNIKKALTHAEVGLIFNYEPQTEYEAKARDFWIFTYLANGINMKDIALLKYKNIKGDRIYLERAKTKGLNKGVSHLIEIVITGELRRIIQKWGNKSIYDGTYVFPILTNNATAEEQYKMVYNAVKTTNKHMKRIASNLNIEGKLTTYVARHSFATVLKNSGKSTEFIKEALAHSSVKTTQNYLAGFEKEAKEEAASYLTDFPKMNVG